MVLKQSVEWKIQHVYMLQWRVEWWCGWKRGWTNSTYWKHVPSVHVASQEWPKLARVAHAPTGARQPAGRGERKWFVYKWVTCGRIWLAVWIFLFLFIWTKLFNCKLLLFLIFFYQNSRFLLSINRDLVHLIWTQKKTQFLTILILLSFY